MVGKNKITIHIKKYPRQNRGYNTTKQKLNYENKNVV